MTSREVQFPAGFVWGSGISAHQAEGGNDANDWADFERAGKVKRGQVSGGASHHFDRYAQDFALAAQLGHEAIKLSVEWSRIEPRPGVWDKDAIAHYVDVVRSAREHGLSPYVVLHHFTSPSWLEAHGWWVGQETPVLFERFVRKIAAPLGHWVDTWITVNEPMLLAGAGYLFGMWPPQQRSYRASWTAARNLVKAHHLAYDAVHELAGVCRVGPAINVTALKQPPNAHVRDRVLGGWLDWLANHYYIDKVQSRSDFIGVQYYSRATVQQLLSGDPLSVPDGMRRLPRTDMGWEVYPKGLYHTVMDTWRRYGLPIIVTENGIADATDAQRSLFIRDHLVWLHRALMEGADIRGYLHWALLDNFEWAEGFDARFGLIEVDYATGERTVRPSARYFEQICRSGSVSLEQPVPFDH